MLTKLGRSLRATVVNIKSAEEYKNYVKKPHILNFTASWCGPCKAMAPVMKSLEEGANGKWELVKVDIDELENQEIIGKFSIQGVPTFYFIKDEKVVMEVVGQRTKGDMEERITQTF